MFKGSPISPISRSQNPITIDRIGTPLSSTKTPIADRYAQQSPGAPSPESPGWLRRVSDRDSLLSRRRKLKYGLRSLTDYSTLFPSFSFNDPRSSAPFIHSSILSNSSVHLGLRRIPRPFLRRRPRRRLTLLLFRRREEGQRRSVLYIYRSDIESETNDFQREPEGGRKGC